VGGVGDQIRKFWAYNHIKDSPVSRIAQIQALVRNGLYYLTEHADDEAMQDEFDIYDIENGILSGRIRKT